MCVNKEDMYTETHAAVLTHAADADQFGCTNQNVQGKSACIHICVRLTSVRVLLCNDGPMHARRRQTEAHLAVYVVTQLILEFACMQRGLHVYTHA